MPRMLKQISCARAEYAIAPAAGAWKSKLRTGIGLNWYKCIINTRAAAKNAATIAWLANVLMVSVNLSESGTAPSKPGEAWQGELTIAWWQACVRSRNRRTALTR